MVFVDDQVEIYYDIRGDRGEKVLLLHGWGCEGKTMKPVSDALEDQFQVMAIDFPGHGQSKKPDSPWGVPEYAELLMKLLKETGFIPCHVIAHSFGCRVAAWIAAEYPKTFGKMVLTGAAGLRPKETEESRKRKRKYARLKSFWMKMERVPGFSASAQRAMARLRDRYSSADYKALDEDMKKTFVRIVNQDLRNIYPRIQQSTLLVWGDLDQETPLWMGREMEKLIPDAGLVLLEGGTHFAFLEQIGRFNLIVKHFLTEA